MKKLYFLLLLLGGFVNAQIVNIPDANFKAKLIALGVDTNADGNIQQSEALARTTLDVSTSNISDLTGIESFTNLTNLNCYNNSISTLNITALTSLTDFSCRNNSLTSLNLNGLTLLTILDCSYNQFPALNFSGLSNLQEINCGNNLLTTINVIGLTNLLRLFCGGNYLTGLNVTNDINLETLYCNNNSLGALNVSHNINLKDLDCSANSFTSFDVSNNINLIYLTSQNGQLTSLDVTHNINLDVLNFSGNQITNIDLSHNVNMINLVCNYNMLTDLDITSMPNLTILGCINNQLTTLDFSNSHKLSFIGAESNLFTTLDLSPITDVNVSTGISIYIQNNLNLQYLFLKNGYHGQIVLSTFACPNMHFVCVDDFNEAQIQSAMVYNENTNVGINSYCSFTPGGDYNTITGTVTFDGNNNSCDALDIPVPNTRININDGTNSGATYTMSTGNYSVYTQSGSFIMTPSNIENPTWFAYSPSNITIPFANNLNNTVTQNFCVTASGGIHPDLEVVIAPIGPARPGFDAVYEVVYSNKGNQTLSGNVSFHYNDAVLDFVSSTVPPNSQASGSLTFNYINLVPFESRSFYITLNVNGPTETPPVNIDDQLDSTAIVNPISGDETPFDNTFSFKQIVVGSLDPNDITCLEGNVVSLTEIGKYLHYIINFENTGTAPAENIVVKDIIDTTKFDVSSLQVLNSSALVTTKLTANVTEFIFQNINLEPNGHGNVLIKIKTKSTLVEGDTVSQKANIYFDYNFPVATNIENTIFQALPPPDFETDASISVYPNPSKDNVTINCNENIKSVQVYDVQGRILETKLEVNNYVNLDVSSYSHGVYFLKITTENGSKVERFVKE